MIKQRHDLLGELGESLKISDNSSHDPYTKSQWQMRKDCTEHERLSSSRDAPRFIEVRQGESSQFITLEMLRNDGESKKLLIGP